MKTLGKNIAARSALLFSLFLIATVSLFAQSPGTSKAAATNGAAAASPQTVNAQQSGAWTVGIDAAKNNVRVANSDTDPVPVKLVADRTARKPVQFRIATGVPVGSTGANAFAYIPAGKRLVIENISAIGRSDPGTRVSLQLFSYFDNGDGVDDTGDITFHRIALTEQGTFSGIATATANHKVLVFADEVINGSHHGISLEVRLDTPAVGTSNSGQVTLSGYLEDLPVVP